MKSPATVPEDVFPGVVTMLVEVSGNNSFIVCVGVQCSHAVYLQHLLSKVQ